MRNILLLLFVFLSSAPVFGQAVWNGKAYYSRQCNNPGCAMCASIQAQLQRPVMQPAMQPAMQQYETVMEARQVKRCNGRQCWYETVMVPVTRLVAQPAQQPVVMQPAPAQPSKRKQVTSVDVLTNTELVETPQDEVEKLLAHLKPSSKAKWFDIGCGDGRYLIAAAKYYGCTCVGIDLNKESVLLARANAIREYVAPLVTIFQGDAREYDLAEADYVSMYLYSELMEQIVPKLKPGTVVASYLHDIPGVETTQHGNFYIGTIQ